MANRVAKTYTWGWQDALIGAWIVAVFVFIMFGLVGYRWAVITAALMGAVTLSVSGWVAVTLWLADRRRG